MYIIDKIYCPTKRSCEIQNGMRQEILAICLQKHKNMVHFLTNEPPYAPRKGAGIAASFTLPGPLKGSSAKAATWQLMSRNAKQIFDANGHYAPRFPWSLGCDLSKN